MFNRAPVDKNRTVAQFRRAGNAQVIKTVCASDSLTFSDVPSRELLVPDFIPRICRPGVPRYLSTRAPVPVTSGLAFILRCTPMDEDFGASC